MNPFRPGVQQIVAATPVPVIPMALSGLWGSFFSRSHEGKAMRRCAASSRASRSSSARRSRRSRRRPSDLHAAVLALRGERR